MPSLWSSQSRAPVPGCRSPREDWPISCRLGSISTQLPPQNSGRQLRLRYSTFLRPSNLFMLLLLLLFHFWFHLTRTMHIDLHSCQSDCVGPLAWNQPWKTPSKDRRVILLKNRDTGDRKLELKTKILCITWSLVCFCWQRIPVRRVPQLTPGMSASAVSNTWTSLFVFRLHHACGYYFFSLISSFFLQPQQQHFYDDDDRMVPSTPTLVVPHRSDGLDQAVQ